MRTLIVYGTHRAIAGAVAPHNPDVHVASSWNRMAMVCGCYTIQSVTNPEDVVQGLVISGPPDLEKLRGMQYDVVIEDHSFDLYAPPWEGHLIRLLLPGSSWCGHDAYQLWRTFLQANVLRR